MATKFVAITKMTHSKVCQIQRLRLRDGERTYTALLEDMRTLADARATSGCVALYVLLASGPAPTLTELRERHGWIPSRLYRAAAELLRLGLVDEIDAREAMRGNDNGGSHGCEDSQECDNQEREDSQARKTHERKRAPWGARMRTRAYIERAGVHAHAKRMNHKNKDLFCCFKRTLKTQQNKTSSRTRAREAAPHVRPWGGIMTPDRSPDLDACASIQEARQVIAERRRREEAEAQAAAAKQAEADQVYVEARKILLGYYRTQLHASVEARTGGLDFTSVLSCVLSDVRGKHPEFTAKVLGKIVGLACFMACTNPKVNNFGAWVRSVAPRIADQFAKGELKWPDKRINGLAPPYDPKKLTWQEEVERAEAQRRWARSPEGQAAEAKRREESKRRRAAEQEARHQEKLKKLDFVRANQHNPNMRPILIREGLIDLLEREDAKRAAEGGGR